MTQSEGRLVGYARVSTADQNLDLQIDALERAGVLPENLYQEHVSAAARRRPQLDLAMMDLRPGDTLIVWRLDRFARSIHDLVRRLRVLEDRGASFRSLNEALDLTTATGRLVLHVMGAIAEFERQLIADRTRAGMRIKMQRGDWRPGRAPKLTPEQAVTLQEWRDQGLQARDIVARARREWGVEISRQLVYNHTKPRIGGDEN